MESLISTCTLSNTILLNVIIIRLPEVAGSDEMCM